MPQNTKSILARTVTGRSGLIKPPCWTFPIRPLPAQEPCRPPKFPGRDSKAPHPKLQRSRWGVGGYLWFMVYGLWLRSDPDLRSDLISYLISDLISHLISDLISDVISEERAENDPRFVGESSAYACVCWRMRGLWGKEIRETRVCIGEIDRGSGAPASPALVRVPPPPPSHNAPPAPAHGCVSR